MTDAVANISESNYTDVFNGISSKIFLMSGLMHNYDDYYKACEDHDYTNAIKSWNYMMAYNN
jgi:hypothetical protein